MTIVNPLTAANLVAQVTVTSDRPQEQQNDLRIDQIVRATVVEGGLDRAVLDLNHQQVRVQSEQSLQPGQQLELKVLTTQPELSFRILTPPLEPSASRLASLLPLLAKTFDWNALLQQMQQGTAGQAGVKNQALEQLAVLLRPAAQLSAEELAAVATSLDRLKQSTALFAGADGSELAAALERVTRQLGHLPVDDLELSPALLGNVKELFAQLEIAVTTKPAWSPELQQLVQQVLKRLQPLMAEPEILGPEGKLGLLPQLLGLNLEAELVRGRTRQALSSLKLSLLDGQETLTAKGAEALHRLELFQICRARLAEQNLIFVPLPISFLEEGFLLVEDERQGGSQQEKSARTHLSLSLRLSSLGNLRIDMLQESSGMRLRVACEDQARADFLQALSGQLQDRLQGLPVLGLNFTLGAESPVRELLKKIVPQSRGMLDQRV